VYQVWLGVSEEQMALGDFAIFNCLKKKEILSAYLEANIKQLTICFFLTLFKILFLKCY